MVTLDGGQGQDDQGQTDRGHDRDQPVGVSVEEAARALGVSVKTVRRRVKAGQLAYREVRGRNGLEHRILLDHGRDRGQAGHGRGDRGHDHGRGDYGQNGRGHDQGRPSTVANGAEHVDLSGLVALVDKLTQQNLELAGRVGFYQNELEHLRGELRALQAPATSNQPESAREPTAPAETISASRPWWRFW